MQILEVESMLNQRQAICERRQAALLALDEVGEELVEGLVCELTSSAGGRLQLNTNAPYLCGFE